MARLDYARALDSEPMPEINRLIGTKLAVQFIRRLGGRPLYFPAKLSATHPIADAIGLSAAERLCRDLHGQKFAIPAPSSQLNWLDARGLRALGLSASEIAKCIGITERHVRRLLGNYPIDGYVVDEAIETLGRHYKIKSSRLRAAALPVQRQLDFGFPWDGKGLRYTFA